MRQLLGGRDWPPSPLGPMGLTRADLAKPLSLFTGTPAPGPQVPSCPMGFCLQSAGLICLGPRDPKNRALAVCRQEKAAAVGWRWLCGDCVLRGAVCFVESSRWSMSSEKAGEEAAGSQKPLTAPQRPVHLADPDGLGTSTPRALCPAKLPPTPSRASGPGTCSSGPQPAEKSLTFALQPEPLALPHPPPSRCRLATADSLCCPRALGAGSTARPLGTE